MYPPRRNIAGRLSILWAMVAVGIHSRRCLEVSRDTDPRHRHLCFGHIGCCRRVADVNLGGVKANLFTLYSPAR